MKSLSLKKNQSLILEPFIYHRMEGLEKTVYLEASTPQLSDVVGGFQMIIIENNFYEKLQGMHPYSRHWI